MISVDNKPMEIRVIQCLRSYRCHYHPRDGGGFPTPAETGVLPFVQVQASDAEDAQRKAHHVTGCPVVTAERLEGGAT